MSDPSAAPTPVFATEREACELLSLCRNTLRSLRAKGAVASPPWFRCGKRILYPLADLQKWSADQVAANMGAGR